MKKNDMNKVKIIPQKRLYKAKVLMNLGAYTEAEIILCKVLKTKTSSDEVIYILCDLYIKQNEFEKALILLEKLFKVKCNHLVLLKIIQIYRNICDYESLVC